MALDPQSSWIQWGATTVIAAFTALIGLFVSFGRDAHKIYREKVDALEKGQATFAANCITREELRDELSRRFDEIDIRSTQQHNHNATLLSGIDSRIGELRDDIKDVHKRIDEGRK